MFSNEKKSKTKLDSEADLPLASRVSKRNSVVSDSERTTPSPRGYAPKTPNEFASFENQNSVSERSERPTLPETGKQLLDRIIEERNNKLLADWEEKQTDLFASNDAHSKNAKTVRSEQIRLLKKAKKPALVVASEIDEEEIPFEIPENWCWCRWGELSESIQYGYNAPAKESGRIKMVRITDIQNGKVQWDTVPFCEISEEEIKTYRLRKNDILFARTGGTVGKSFLVDEEPENAVYAGYLIRTQYNSEKLNPKYMKMFMESQLYWDQLKNGTIATAQPNCNGQTLSKMILPLPPLAVQNAIVETLEQVLPLVDVYENAILQKEELKSALPDKVKKAILQEAITGKLTENWRKSATIKESGKQLLDRIIEERNAKALADWEEALKKNPKAKKPVPVVASEIDEEEIPFEVPENWCWCHLGEIFKVTMGQSPEGSNVGEEKEGMEFHQGKIFFTDKYIATSNQKTSEITKIAEPGSILLCMRAPVGKVNITDRQICIGRGLSSIVPLGEIALEWAFHLFETLESDFIDKSTGSTFKAITGDVVKEQLIPLPPLEEQQEIVKKVEELLELCK